MTDLFEKRKFPFRPRIYTLSLPAWRAKGAIVIDAISEGLRKLILAGIGAVAATKEKSEVILDELVKKGELTVEQGKVLNEELKHNIKDAIRENVTLHVVTPEDNRGEADGDETDDTADFVLDAVDSLTDEQLSALKARIAEREKESASGAPQADGEKETDEKKTDEEKTEE